WLAERGHVRGELIALQLRAESDAALADAVTVFVAEHSRELLGALGDLEVKPVWRRGFIDHVTVTSTKGGLLAEPVLGLLDHPSGGRVRTLRLVADAGATVDAAVEALGDRNPARLRHLVLGASDNRIRSVDLTPIWNHLPNLYSLIVRGRFDRAPIHHDG